MKSSFWTHSSKDLKPLGWLWGWLWPVWGSTTDWWPAGFWWSGGFLPLSTFCKTLYGFVLWLCAECVLA
eukprot:5689545-Amphidinium_carterae.1